MHSANELNPVGNTALMIAFLRSEEAELRDKLFEDPYARAFAEPRIDGLVRRWEVEYPVFPAIIRLRTRWIDDVVRRLLDEGITQVIVLGAGCCTRAARLGRGRATHYEVDQATVLAFKRERLVNAGYSYDVVDVPVDYTKPGLIEALVDRGLDPNQPTLVVWEGNTYYLPEPSLLSVLRTLAKGLPELVLVMDYYNRILVEGLSKSNQMRRAVALLRSFGSPWLGSIEDPGELGVELDLSVAEKHDFRSLQQRYLPNADLGVDADVEYFVCVMKSASRNGGA